MNKRLPCPIYWQRLELYIDGEEWKYIEGYEGYYEISSFGRVKSIGRLVERDLYCGYLTKKERILKQGIARKRNGYLLVTLTKCNIKKSFFVHRLVGKAYIGNPDNKRTINHIKGNVKDNRVTELEWNTDYENTHHAINVLMREYRLRPATAGKDHHSNKKVFCITNNREYYSTRDAANKLKIQQSKVSLVCNGKRSHTHGYVFKFVI